MGRVINGSQMEKTPVVLLKERPGSKFIGTKVRQKPGKGEGNLIFEFTAESGDAYIGQATGNKIIKNGRSVNEYAEVPVDAGDKVAIFGDTQLNDKLSQVLDGERVLIVFNELKLNEKTGRAFNDYKVEVL